MKQIFKGRSIESSIVTGLLTNSDIPFEVKGANLSNLFGELPMEDTMISVWVSDEDFSLAKKLLKDVSDPEHH